METPSEVYYDYDGTEVENADEIIYYDEWGNEISEKEALTETLEIGDRTITYLRRNHTIVSMSWRGGDDPFPIVVHTHEHMRLGNAIGNAVNTGFALLYCGELVIATLVYFRKCRRISHPTTCKEPG